MTEWDASHTKAQLRTTALRLGQLQRRTDTESQAAKRHVAELLAAGDVPRARARAHAVMKEERLGDILEVLEMHCGILAERIYELDKGRLSNPSVEAVCSIIYAAPLTGSSELEDLAHALSRKSGPYLPQNAPLDRFVSRRILDVVNAISGLRVEPYMAQVAQTFGVEWNAFDDEMELAALLSESLDLKLGATVELQQLRMMCARGIPESPRWLRPRLWKLFLSFHSTQKTKWRSEDDSRRQQYYDLARKVLEPMGSLPEPEDRLTRADAELFETSRDLDRLPQPLMHGLLLSVPVSDLCPFDVADNASDPVPSYLDQRVASIARKDGLPSPSGIPQITVDDSNSFDGVNGTSGNQLPVESAVTYRSNTSALLRILHVHKALHPTTSPHLTSIAVTLYCALMRETDREALAHLEADTFWMLQELDTECDDLHDQERSQHWMREVSERVKVADPELHEVLLRMQLDPAMPYFTYRWLTPLLTYTLSLPDLFMAWDAILAKPTKTPNSNLKLEFLTDICVTLILKVRRRLIRAGDGSSKYPALWEIEPAHSPLLDTTFNVQSAEAFSEGMVLLQDYPMPEVGGIPEVIQGALELATQRERPSFPTFGGRLGARLRDRMGWKVQSTIVEAEADDLSEHDLPLLQASQPATTLAHVQNTIWRGITNRTAMEAPESPGIDTPPRSHTPEPLQESYTGDDQAAGRFQSLKTSILRGITNQSAMEVPPSPLPLASSNSHYAQPSPSHHNTDSISSSVSSISQTWRSLTGSTGTTPKSPTESDTEPGSARLWGYADRLKDSDAAARIAKASTNWRALAFDTIGRRRESVDSMASAKSETALFSPPMRQTNGYASRSPSLPTVETYTPPPRPSHFRQPRDSMMPSPRRAPTTDSTDYNSDGGPSGLNGNADSGGIQSALASLTARVQQPTPRTAKAGPKPLLLSTNSLMTPSSTPLVTRSATSTPTPQWTDTLRRGIPLPPAISPLSVSPLARSPIQHIQQESLSSVSEPTNHAFGWRRRRSDWDSDGNMTDSSSVAGRAGPSSARFPANRSPAVSLSRQSSVSSSSEHGRRGWRIVDATPDSPVTLPSSPPLRTPPMPLLSGLVHIRAGTDSTRSSLTFDEFANPSPRQRATIPRSSAANGDEDGEQVPGSAKTPRLRSKRHAARPGHLKLQRTTSGVSSGVILEQGHPSPFSPTPASNGATLAPDPKDNMDAVPTPRALDYDNARTPTSSTSRSPNSPARRVKQNSADTVRDRDSLAISDASEEAYDMDGLLSAYEGDEESTNDH